MRKFFVLIISVFLSFNWAFSQGSGYCVKEKTYEGNIDLTVDKTIGKKEYSADYEIDMCYTGNEELVVQIKRHFKLNGNNLTGKKLDKSLSKLFVEVSLNGDKDFHFKINPEALVDEEYTYVVAPNENTEWTNKTISITHNFKFSAEGQSKDGEQPCTISIPDGSTLKEIVAVPETIVVEKIIKEEPMPVQKIEPEIAEPPVAVKNYNCIDSVEFYYRKTLELYNSLSFNNPDQRELAQARMQYEDYKKWFEYFSADCINNKTSNFKSQFNRISLQLDKIFSGQQNTLSNSGRVAGSGSQANNQIEDDQSQGKSKKSFKFSRGMVKNPLRYLLGGFIGLIVVVFIIFKFGKKIVKKAKKKK